MSKFQIRIQSADGTAEQQVVDTATGKPVVIQAKAKTTYTLQPEAGGAMPQGVVVKRVGNSLKVFFPPKGENAEAEESADLEVLGYFEAPEQVLQGVAANGNTYAYAAPNAALSTLTDGEAAVVALAPDTANPAWAGLALLGAGGGGGGSSPALNTAGDSTPIKPAEGKLFVGTALDDNQVGGDGPDTMIGGQGDDTMSGGAGNDEMSAGDGADVMDGGEGDDTLDGGSGSDSIAGGAGNDMATGGAGDDTLEGGVGDDTLQGGMGEDLVQGGAGNDALQGNQGNDTLDGGAGNDLLDGGVGDDSLNGGDGKDTLLGGENNDILIAGAGDDLLDGGEGNDTLAAGTGEDTLLGQGGDDYFIATSNPGKVVYIDGGDGNDTLDLTQLAGPFKVLKPEPEPEAIVQPMMARAFMADDMGITPAAMALASPQVANTAGLTTIVASDGSIFVVQNVENIVGLGSDVLTGTNGDDEMDGEGGNDTMYGYDGDDYIDGGPGKDVLFGGNGIDTLIGDEGDDILNGDAGNDILNAGEGNDTLNGGTGNDLLNGDEGDDVLNGGEGKDTLNGGVGNDLLNGDAGDDALNGGEGNDTLNGGIGNDVLNGDAGDDALNGGEGNDTLNGGIGNDVLNGDAGNDVLNGGEGDDTLDGGEGNDAINGDAGNDVLNGGAGSDTLNGGEGNDLINGGAGDDLIDGGAGNDTIEYTAGNDTILGGAGDDLIVIQSAPGSVVHVDGGAGTDTLDMSQLIGPFTVQSGNGLTTVTSADGTVVVYESVEETIGTENEYLVGTPDGDTLDGKGGNDTVVGLDGDDLLLGGTGNDSLLGGGGNDTLNGGEGDDTLDGGVGDDTLLGGAGNDSLNGGAGNDVLDGGEGDDTLLGGTGNDSLSGGTGNDVLDGGEDNDTLLGGAGNDSLNGGAGNDALDGGEGDDTLLGGAGNDTLTGGSGANLLDGGDGDDVLTGGDNSETLLGGAGSDTINGGFGPDLIDGGEGNDLIDGGAGADTVLGGAGNDTILTGSGDDSIDAGSGNDLVIAQPGGHKDITGGEGIDTLDLSNLEGEVTITGSLEHPENGLVITAPDGTVINAKDFENIVLPPSWVGGTVDATDNVAYAYVYSMRQIEELKSAQGFQRTDSNWGTSLLNSIHNIQYVTLPDNALTDLNISLYQEAFLSVGTFVNLEVQAQGEDGLWYTIAKTASLTNGTYGFSSTYGFPIGIVDALGLLPSSLGGTIKNLQGGNYRIIGTTNEVVNGWGHLDVGFTTSPKAIPNVYKPEAGGPVTGNVITDDSFHDADPDQDALGVPPAKLQIQQADGTFVNANGNVVEGQYGKLTIDANGDYSYQVKADFAAIGKVDEFVYRLVGANGQLDTAKLFIRIGGDRTDLTWSTTDPSAPATETGSVVVTDNHDLSEVTVVKRKEYTELSDGIGYTIAVGALTGVIYAPFTEVDKSTHFSTDDRTVSTVTVQFLQGSGAALGMMTEVKLVNTETGEYFSKSYFEVVDSLFTDAFGWLLNTLLANGEGWPGDMAVRFYNVPAGNWQVVVDSKPYVASAASFVSGSVSVETEYLVEYVATASHPAHGNVITDDSGDGVDKVPSGAILTIERPNGSYVVPNYDGIQIKGDYGTLWIRSNGDYTYTPSTYSLDAIGKVDTFTYTINGQNGKMDSGVITFRINASALPNEWDSLDSETFNYEVNIDAQNRLVGTAENDVLDGRVVQDANVALTFQGGAGDDVFIVYSAGSSHFAHANGGAGTDTLLWNAKDANLVLSSIADKIDNVEAISLKDSHDSAQTLVLTVDDFLKVTDGNLTDGRHSLFVRGDNNDKVDIELAASANGQGWVLNGENVVRDGVTYVTYSYQLDGTHQTAYQLLIEQGMTVI